MYPCKPCVRVRPPALFLQGCLRATAHRGGRQIGVVRKEVQQEGQQEVRRLVQSVALCLPRASHRLSVRPEKGPEDQA